MFFKCNQKQALICCYWKPGLKGIDASDLGLKSFVLLSIVFLHSVAMLVIVLYLASEIALLG